MEGIQVPQLHSAYREELEAPISEEAIKSLKSNKAPGLAGFTGAFYKTFASLLTPHLTNLFNSFGELGAVTSSMLEALLTLIPKPGKDPKDFASYRPIALLNIESRIYTKILHTRLERFFPVLIHPDQFGFVTQRQTHNLSRLIHLLGKADKKNIPSLIVALDAEQAFNRVAWLYLH